MIELPAALSVAASPGHESWWPPTMTKSSGSGAFGAFISATVICTGCQPFFTWVRNQTFTGPASHIAFSFRPAVRAMPMQGITAISVFTLSGVGLPQTGFTEPKGTAVFSGPPQFIITAPIAPRRPAMRCFSCRAGEYESSVRMILPRTSLPSKSFSAPAPT